jgi:hypothetical protein
MAARTMILEPIEKWTEALEISRERVRAAAQSGRHGGAILAHATAGRVVAVWTLDPAPVDPAAHLEQATVSLRLRLGTSSRPTKEAVSGRLRARHKSERETFYAFRSSISAFSSQNVMSISRDIAVAARGAPAPARACPCGGRKGPNREDRRTPNILRLWSYG